MQLVHLKLGKMYSTAAHLHLNVETATECSCRVCQNCLAGAAAAALADVQRVLGRGASAQHQFWPAPTHQSNVDCLQAFIGGSPSFEAVDGSGIAIGQKVATTSATSTRPGDGGLGSVGDVLLSIVGQGTLRYAVSPQHIMSIGFFGHDQVHRISLQLQHVPIIAMIVSLMSCHARS